MSLRVGRLVRLVASRPGCLEWEVQVEGEVQRRPAISFPALHSSLAVGMQVWLNTTATELHLGTGGQDFILAPAEPAFDPTPSHQRRTDGHLLKLRYTPLQLRVCAVEEDASPHRSTVEGCASLAGAPVVAAELHSQAMAVAIAAHAVSPRLRIAYVQVDAASLPLGLSRLAPTLREAGVLQGTATVGQGFGGDVEAVNIYSGLLAARSVLGAELIVVGQGPGNAGTGTRFGFSGMALVEALHAAEHLGGRPVLAVRASGADPRPRHLGVSHHTWTLLECLRTAVGLPVPQEFPVIVQGLAARAGKHEVIPTSTEVGMAALRAFDRDLTTMGRTVTEDPLFFAAAVAAGMVGAALAAGRRSAEDE